ncbi:transposase family protein [Streptomyces sp. NPDC001544]|uniref:transposase family protein n=1 Tax=Streptomyces sp. NPDC001544 TaxID=3364584 RepID=UPI0036AD5CF5
MRVAPRGGGCRCELQSDQRALVGLVYLRRHDTFTQAAACSGIAVRNAQAYTRAVIDLSADRAPGLLIALREADPVKGLDQV